MAKVTLTSKSNAMKSYLPLLTFVIVLTSCSSVYKSGQTPDDVYFSPERQRDEYVRVDERRERQYQQNDELSREDRYLRMKTRNRRYGLLDEEVDYYAYNGGNYYRYNDYYRMNAFRYNPNMWTWNMRFGGFHGYDPFFYNPYYYNPYHYNPYYSGVVYGNVSPRYNRPRTGNMSVFDRNGNYNNGSYQKGNSRVFSSGGSDGTKTTAAAALMPVDFCGMFLAATTTAVAPIRQGQFQHQQQ
jgi:hypothetical protein